MAPPAPKQPKVFCQFPVQLVVVAVLFAVAGSLPTGEVPNPLSALLVTAAIALSVFCFAKAEPPESSSS